MSKPEQERERTVINDKFTCVSSSRFAKHKANLDRLYKKYEQMHQSDFRTVVEILVGDSTQYAGEVVLHVTSLSGKTLCVDSSDCVSCTYQYVDQQPGPHRGKSFMLLGHYLHLPDGHNGHANLLILNHDEGVAVHVEPHGEKAYYDELYGMRVCIEQCVSDCLMDTFGRKYRFVYHSEWSCPSVQVLADFGKGVCRLHALYRLCLELWNPTLTSDVISNYMLAQASTKHESGVSELLLKMADVMYSVTTIIDLIDAHSNDVNPYFRRQFRKSLELPRVQASLLLRANHTWDFDSVRESLISDERLAREVLLQIVSFHTLVQVWLHFGDTVYSEEYFKEFIARRYQGDNRDMLHYWNQGGNVGKQLCLLLILSDYFHVDSDEALQVVLAAHREGLLPPDHNLEFLLSKSRVGASCISQGTFNKVPREFRYLLGNHSAEERCVVS